MGGGPELCSAPSMLQAPVLCSEKGVGRRAGVQRPESAGGRAGGRASSYLSWPMAKTQAHDGTPPGAQVRGQCLPNSGGEGSFWHNSNKLKISN